MMRNPPKLLPPEGEMPARRRRGRARSQISLQPNPIRKACAEQRGTKDRKRGGRPRRRHRRRQKPASRRQHRLRKRSPPPVAQLWHCPSTAAAGAAGQASRGDPGSAREPARHRGQSDIAGRCVNGSSRCRRASLPMRSRRRPTRKRRSRFSSAARRKGFMCGRISSRYSTRPSPSIIPNSRSEPMCSPRWRIWTMARRSAGT